MGRKHSDLEVEMRINSIIEQMTKGVIATKDLLRFIMDRYGLTKSQSEKDIRIAKERLGGLFTDWEKQQHKNLSLQRYNLLFNKNYTIQDYREARNVQQQIDKLLGNEEPIQIGADVKLSIPVIEWVKNESNTTESTD